jgi:ferritin-like metal-binding protein YciE
VAQNDNLRDKLITYLQDAYAMEHQIVQMLEGQVKDTQKYPQIQARIQQHLDETRTHEQRMADRLGAYNEKPSTTKSIGSNLMGSLVGAAAGGRTDALAKTARDDYMTEHMEIASYGALIATAQAFGDGATIQAAQANLRDEVRMAHWLEQHLAEAVVYSFQEDGIAIDKTQIPTIQGVVAQSMQQARSGLSGMGATDNLPSGATNMPAAPGLGHQPDRALHSEASLDASGSETDSRLNYPADRTNEGPNPTI